MKRFVEKALTNVLKPATVPTSIHSTTPDSELT